MVDGKHFITIEGSEGTGKSTVLKTIQACLEDVGQDVLITREPGGTPVAEAIRHVVLGAWEGETISNEVELLLMFASRKQHLDHLILPALEQGKWVVSDRFVDASFAYQGYGRGVDQTFLEQLTQRLLGDFKPGLTLLLDCPVDIALSRIANRGKDRIEQEKIDFFQRVREGYLALAKAQPERFCLVDVSVSIEEVAKSVEQAVRQYAKRVLEG